MSMQNRTDGTGKTETPLLRDILKALRYYMGGRRTLIIAAVAIAGGGAALNWGWLVAVGVAPLLLALIPCAAMCALGMCMNHGKDGAGKKGGGCCSIDSDDDPGPEDRQG